MKLEAACEGHGGAKKVKVGSVGAAGRQDQTLQARRPGIWKLFGGLEGHGRILSRGVTQSLPRLLTLLLYIPITWRTLLKTLLEQGIFKNFYFMLEYS